MVSINKKLLRSYLLLGIFWGGSCSSSGSYKINTNQINFNNIDTYNLDKKIILNTDRNYNDSLNPNSSPQIRYFKGTLNSKKAELFLTKKLHSHKNLYFATLFSESLPEPIIFFGNLEIEKYDGIIIIRNSDEEVQRDSLLKNNNYTIHFTDSYFTSTVNGEPSNISAQLIDNGFKGFYESENRKEYISINLKEENLPLPLKYNCLLKDTVIYNYFTNSNDSAQFELKLNYFTPSINTLLSKKIIKSALSPNTNSSANNSLVNNADFNVSEFFKDLTKERFTKKRKGFWVARNEINMAVTYVNNNLVSFVSEGYFLEGMNGFSYDLEKNKQIIFDEVFLPASKNKILKILTNKVMVKLLNVNTPESLKSEILKEIKITNNFFICESGVYFFFNNVNLNGTHINDILSSQGIPIFLKFKEINESLKPEFIKLINKY